MKKYSERDLDRSWSLEEVQTLSEGELTKLAFLRDYKNLLFFLPVGIIFYFIASRFGLFGKIIGWLGVLTFSFFAIQGIINFALCLISLIGTPFADKKNVIKNLFWKLLQLSISFANLAIYTSLGYLIYAGMYDIDIMKYIPW